MNHTFNFNLSKPLNGVALMTLFTGILWTSSNENVNLDLYLYNETDEYPVLWSNSEGPDGSETFEMPINMDDGIYLLGIGWSDGDGTVDLVLSISSLGSATSVCGTQTEMSRWSVGHRPW